MITLYGIPNCDTVKKARQWLAAQGIDYAFHDFKKQGIAADKLAQWIDSLGLEHVINRKGTTWRALSDAEKALATIPASAIDLLICKPSLIKRPVLEHNGKLHLGFKEADYQEAFGK